MRILKVLRALFVLCTLAVIPYIIKDVSEEYDTRQRIVEITRTAEPTTVEMVKYTMYSIMSFAASFLLLTGACQVLIWDLRRRRGQKILGQVNYDPGQAAGNWGTTGDPFRQ